MLQCITAQFFLHSLLPVATVGLMQDQNRHLVEVTLASKTILQKQSDLNTKSQSKA